MNDTVIEINNLSKAFNGNPILKNVCMRIEKGSIHGLLGLNGAGKSTVIKILSGMLQPDSGNILINGQKVVLRNPLAAKKAGIATIHQSIPLNQSISVAQYMYMNVSVVNTGEFRPMSFTAMNEKCARIFGELSLDINPHASLKSLSPGQLQLVHIAIAVALKPAVLLLDEPYSMLTTVESEVLSRLFKSMSEGGMAILMVTHEMNDAINYCDEISILKDGVLSEFLNINATRQELIEAITDKNQAYTYPYIKRSLKRNFLIVDRVCTNKLKDISFTLSKGEILGVAGLLGSGKTSLARTLFGVYPVKSGQIILNGTRLKLKMPYDAIKNKICLMPEDIINEGVIEAFSVKNNISLPNLKDVSHFQLLNRSKENRIANKFIKKYVIKTRSAAEPAAFLSAGNKQKLSISKWIFSNSSVLIMDDPTSAVDIASKVEIYNFMNRYCLEGGSILFISSDFDELIGMCDRILLMREGRISQIFSRKEFDADEIISALSK